ncbi:MAG: hypothetical protein CR961_01740, partial [Polaribacter sp.]
MLTNKNWIVLLLALMCQFAMAQKTIKGVVADESGPLPGVAVFVKGTSTGTETDFDGNYVIKAKKGQVLVYSFLGMETVEKTVGSASKINVTLKQSKENVLEEVVVTGFQKIDKKLFTGSAIRLKQEDVKLEGVSDVSRGLQGNVSGVSVENVSGTFGATP